MKPIHFLEDAQMPDGTTIALTEQDGVYEVAINGLELMSTRRHTSEERIAELACAHVRTKKGAAVLIGGLGFGFTLRAALLKLGRESTVVQVEILDAVIQWNKNPKYPLAGSALLDKRVTLVQEDVVEVIRRSPCGFDSIILDVDNGPSAFSTDGNNRLYDLNGLELAKQALRPGGVVAYWSANPDAAFEKRMAKAGFAVEVQRCRAHGNSGSWHTIFLGRVAGHPKR